MRSGRSEKYSQKSFIIQMAAEEKTETLCCVFSRYLGLFFEGVISTLQLLHLLLGSVVFSHVGPLCGNGLQRTAVTQYFFIEKLE